MARIKRILAVLCFCFIRAIRVENNSKKFRDYPAILPRTHRITRNFSIFTVTADTRGSFSCSSVWFSGRK